MAFKASYSDYGRSKDDNETFINSVLLGSLETIKQKQKE